MHTSTRRGRGVGAQEEGFHRAVCPLEGQWFQRAGPEPAERLVALVIAVIKKRHRDGSN
jgi:hypothetical protein